MGSAAAAAACGLEVEETGMERLEVSSANLGFIGF